MRKKETQAVKNRQLSLNWKFQK